MKYLVFVFLVFALTTSFLSACNDRTVSQNSDDRKSRIMTIGVAMDVLDHAFWQSDLQAMNEKAAELGVELVVKVAEGDANKQNKQIEELIAQKVRAIICVARDGNAVLESVKKCNQAAIPFIFNDRAVFSNDDAKVSYGFGADNYKLCKAGTEWLVNNANKNKNNLKVLELVGDLADNNVLDRSKGLEEVVNANKDSIEITRKITTEWNAEKAYDGVVSAFQGNPEINCIFLHSDFLLSSVQSALKKLGRWKKIGEDKHIIIATVGGDALTLDLIKEGYVEMCMSMPIVNEGKKCVQAAYDLAKGRALDKSYVMDAGFIVDIENFSEAAPISFGYYVKK